MGSPDTASSFIHWDSPRGNESSCFECHRTFSECKPAGSRRGGNFSHLKRTKNSTQPTCIMDTSPLNPESTGSSHGGGNNNSVGVDKRHTKEHTYAELKNPCDALQILASIATTDVQSRVLNAGSPQHLRSNIHADGGDLSSNLGFDDESAQMHYSTPSSLLPLSEAARLVNDDLGPLTTLQLLRL